jgi:hypothetical protein
MVAVPSTTLLSEVLPVTVLPAVVGEILVLTQEASVVARMTALGGCWLRLLEAPRGLRAQRGSQQRPRAELVSP